MKQYQIFIFVMILFVFHWLHISTWADTVKKISAIVFEDCVQNWGFYIAREKSKGALILDFKTGKFEKVFRPAEQYNKFLQAGSYRLGSLYMRVIKGRKAGSQACALADRHVWQLINHWLTILEVEHDQWLVSLRYAAGVPWGVWVNFVVQRHNCSVVILFLNSPQQRTVPSAVVCVKAFWRVQPLPAQIFLEVDVQRTKTASCFRRPLLAIIWIQGSPVSSSSWMDAFTRDEPDKNIWPRFFVFVVQLFRCRSAEINLRNMHTFVCRYRACCSDRETIVCVRILKPLLNHWSDIERHPLLFTG